MKVKATIVLITVLSGLLVACNADPDGSVVTTADPGTSVVNTVASTSIEHEYHFDLSPGCGERNYFYDIRPYLMYEGDESYDGTVTSEEFKAYIEDKLDSIDYSDAICARGLYQDYGFGIIKRDEFEAWKIDNDIPGLSYHRDGTWVIYREIEWEESAYKSIDIGTYKDPSGKFIILTDCYDYKVIYEFFNGEYEPEETDEYDEPIQDDLSENDQIIIDAFSDYNDIEPPFVMSPSISYDIDNDGDEELVAVVSGNYGIYSSNLLIYDPDSKDTWCFCNPDTDYEIELVDDRLVVHVTMNENCRDKNDPYLQSGTGTIVKDGTILYIVYDDVDQN
jgi:hypothetical protein